MISLKNEDFIAKGTNRSCYLHPSDNSKCIKITHSNDYSETKKEIYYYLFLQNQNISWKNLAKYYGCIDTDLGKGEVFDLVKDYDGNISKTLSSYLQTPSKTKLVQNPVVLLQELKSYCFENNIIVKDLNTKNMLYQKLSNNEAKLVLIDGLSNPKRFVYLNKCKPYMQNLHKKLWDRFENSLHQKYYFNDYFIKLLNQ